MRDILLVLILLLQQVVMYRCLALKELSILGSNRIYYNTALTGSTLAKRYFHVSDKLYGVKRGDNNIPSIDAQSKAFEAQQKLSKLKEEMNSRNKKVFDETVQFPSKFTIKVIGINDTTFTADTIDKIAKILSKTSSEIDFTTRESKTTEGKSASFISLTISPLFNSSTELYAVYDILNSDPRVKFVL